MLVEAKLIELEDMVLGEAGKHISTCTYTHTHVHAHTGTIGSVAYVEAKHNVKRE